MTLYARVWDLHCKQIRPKAGACYCQSFEPAVVATPAALQIITVFLGSFIGGALFNQFNQWINDPTSAITILGTAAPLTSIFFLTYIQLQVWLACQLSNSPPVGGYMPAALSLPYSGNLPSAHAVLGVNRCSSVMNTYIWQISTIILSFCRVKLGLVNLAFGVKLISIHLLSIYC